MTVRPRSSFLAATLMLAPAVSALIVLGTPQAGSAVTETHNPGATLFQEKGCSHCHGTDGNGTDKGPSLARIGRRLKREQIESQIVHGGKEMPPFGDVLDANELRQLVEYLHDRRK